MLELSPKTNLLEENDYRYSLQDVPEPILYRDVYSYDEVPKVAFNHRRVPINMQEDIWITHAGAVCRGTTPESHEENSQHHNGKALHEKRLCKVTVYSLFNLIHIYFYS